MKTTFFIFSLALFILPLNIAVAGGTADSSTTGKSPESITDQSRNPQSTWQEGAEKSFKDMCEFIELDEEQVKQARQIFDSRFREMNEIFSSARAGGLSQAEARDKLTESFKKHREKFENLLREEQRTKLEQWENPRPQKQSRDRRS